MSHTPRPQQGPEPTDLDGWRQAISQGLLPKLRLEAIVAAIQDLGPLTDPKILNPLIKHLSDAMTKLLRKLVYTNHPNKGDDIIYRVQSQLFEALLKPNSADGKALRKAFTPRVSFRIKDALAAEYQHSHVPVDRKIHKAAKGRKIAEIVKTAPDHDSGEPANDSDHNDKPLPQSADSDLTLLEQQTDIEKFLKAVPDLRKRLAFHLHMDDIPYGSTRGHSIASALGVSAKTAKEWVEEVQEILQSDAEIQNLRKLTLGDHT
jgi:hypothetical protein